MMVFLRLLLSIACGCQLVAVICQIAAGYQRVGEQHTADVVGFTGIAFGVVFAIVGFFWLGRLFRMGEY